MEICARIPAILEREAVPCVSGVQSLLGAGRQSLLRTRESCVRPKTITDHCTRIHAMPLQESLNRRPVNNIGSFGFSNQKCINIQLNMVFVQQTVQVLIGRQSAGPIIRRQAVGTGFYGKIELLRRTLGHLSAVYCVLFDRSGKYIITVRTDQLNYITPQTLIHILFPNTTGRR